MTAFAITIAILIVFLLTLAGRYFVREYIKPVDIWDIPVKIPNYFSELDEEMVSIGEKNDLSKEDYWAIFRYFIYGVHAYSSKSKARIIYPGVSGTRGSTVEGLEGFARSSVLIGAWIAGGRETKIWLDKASTQYDLIEHLRSGLEAGTNPFHPEYWGDINDYDQRIVEAADIALCIWITRDVLFNKLRKKSQHRIQFWLSQIDEKRIYGGNWLLFRIIVKSILNKMGSYQFNVDQDYNEFKSFYVGDGWFGDGKDGAIDYYNAWQMHYMLFWITKICPNYDSLFIKDVQERFGKCFQYFISTAGFPAFGRSICYRLAIATPLIIMAERYPEKWSGKGRRSLDVTWAYFLKNNALSKGGISQGYFKNNENLLENYSGRASSLWSLRSMIIALIIKDNSAFWNKDKEALLPVEKKSYNMAFHSVGIHLIGNRGSREITLKLEKSIMGACDENSGPYKEMTFVHKALQKILKRPLRPSNMNHKYGRATYSNINLFFNEK